MDQTSSSIHAGSSDAAMGPASSAAAAPGRPPRRRRPRPQPRLGFGLPLLASAAFILLRASSALTAAVTSINCGSAAFVMGGRWSRSSPSSTACPSSSSVPTIVLYEEELFASISSARPSAHAHLRRRHRHQVWAGAASAEGVANADAPTIALFTNSTSSSNTTTDGGRGLVVNFPGGGKFFYWQSGVATFLNSHFDLRNANLVGASAGSLTATLMACHVDAHHATAAAVRIMRKYGIYERRLGLVGVWGALVREWLDEVLPPNAHELCNGRVHISVLCILPYRRYHVSEFTSKKDLIDTCIASAHLPVVMDGKPFFRWRGRRCVDASILVGRKHVPKHLRDHERVTFDHVEDEALRVASKLDFMSLSDPDGLKALVQTGYRFAERLSTSGLLPPTIESLRRLDQSPLAVEKDRKEEEDKADGPSASASTTTS